MLKLKLFSIYFSVFLSMALTTAHANDAYVKMDEQLKRIIAENANPVSIMNLHNFVDMKEKPIDIYKVNSVLGTEFVPQDEMSLMLYNAFIENGFLPIIAILETNKVFLKSQSSQAKK